MIDNEIYNYITDCYKICRIEICKENYHIVIPEDDGNTIAHFDLIKDKTQERYHILLYNAQGVKDDNSPELNSKQLEVLNFILKAILNFTTKETYWDFLCKMWNQIYPLNSYEKGLPMPDYTKITWN